MDFHHTTIADVLSTVRRVGVHDGFTPGDNRASSMRGQLAPTDAAKGSYRGGSADELDSVTGAPVANSVIRRMGRVGECIIVKCVTLSTTPKEITAACPCQCVTLIAPDEVVDTHAAS